MVRSSPGPAARLAGPVAAATFLAAVCLIWLWGVTSARHLAVNLVATYLLAWGAVLVLSRKPRADVHLRFVLALASLGLVWFALELAGLGLVDHRMLFGADHRHPWLRPGNVFDPELLVVRQPYLKLSGVQERGNIARNWCMPPSGPGYPYELSYDANGFRNAEDLSRADVAVIGDSFVEAVEVPHERTLTSLLAREIGSPVANLGGSGYGPQQELVVLRRYALPLEPAVVVWAFTDANDLQNIWSYEEKVTDLDRLPRRPTRVERSFTKNALNALYRVFETCEPADHARNRYAVFRTADGRRERLYFMDTEEPITPRELEALDRFRAILADAHERTRAAGARLVLLFVPTKFRVYGGFVEFPEQSVCRAWTPNDLPTRLERLAAEISPEIDFLDLTPVFAAQAAQGELLYLPDDTHWTEAGHELAARALASLVQGSRGLPIKTSRLAAILRPSS